MKRTIGLLLFASLAVLVLWPLIPIGQAGHSTEDAKISKQNLPRRTLAARPAKDDPVKPATVGLPNTFNEKAPMSAAVATFVGGRNATFNHVTIAGDFSGRENYIADRAATFDDFTGVFPNLDDTITKVAFSEHTFANGFNENVVYYGDASGNLFVGTDVNPGVNVGPSVDALRQINIPSLVATGANGGVTLLNVSAGDCTDDQPVITGIAVNPVADLGDFGLCGTIGEVVYVSTLDTGACSANAAGQPFRTRIFAFAFTDGAGAGAATPAGALQLVRNPNSNAGIAVDDDGSLYFHLVDNIARTNSAIFKVTETSRTVAACAGLNPRVNRVIASVPSGLSGGITANTGQGTAASPIIVSAGYRLTNYSGPSTTWGNIESLVAGPGNVIYAALARSFVDGDPTTGGFTNPSALGPTPSMIISFADQSGAFDVCSSEVNVLGGTQNIPGQIPVADGFADVAQAGLTRLPGVNNFRVFALGNGPDIRPVPPSTTAVIPGLTSSTLKLDMQIDPSNYSGIAVNEEGTVYVISGGNPALLGGNPSASRGEILAFQDTCPADRRADFLDFRGDAFPGTNVGDGDSDRFDHIFFQAPNDGTGNPSGLSGLATGFLRYTNRLAPNAISPGVTLGQTAGQKTQADDSTDGPILFESLDPSHQVAGGDDQSSPNRGDDSDGLASPVSVNNPAIATPLGGGFEFVFGVPGPNGNVWNGFFLNSNGNISFNGGDTDNTPTNSEWYSGLAKIAPAWVDLNPAARAANLGSFPVQAIGFAGVNAFKVRFINVPQFGREACTGGDGGRSNTAAVTLYDDGTGIDENTNQPLNPANPIGNNALPFDLQEGPTDLRFTREPTTNTLVGAPARAPGSGNFVFDYARMVLIGTNAEPVISGYTIGNAANTNPPGLCEINLGEAARAADANAFGVLPGGQTASTGSCLIGEGTEPALFERFSDGTDQSIGSQGEIFLATPDYDLRNESNDPQLATPTRQRDLNRGRVAFVGVAAPPGPVVTALSAGTFVVAPNQTASLINALGPVDILVSGSGFVPNETTIVCSGTAEQRPGKTVTTAMELRIDNDNNGTADVIIPLTNVTPVSPNLVRGTLPALAPLFAGTAFPISPTTAIGPNSVLRITTSYTGGDNNAFGAVSNVTSANATTLLGTRAPVVLSATANSGDCSLAQNISIVGAAFRQGDNVTANVTSVTAVAGGTVVTATSFSIVDSSHINATFNFPPGSGGRLFYIFANGPNGSSRNLTSLPAGTPAGVPLGNEAGNAVTFSCLNAFQFSAAAYNITEDCTTIPVTITRGIGGPAASSVDIATSDGTAVQKSDYTITLRTINFAAGETSKVVDVPITEDSFNEGTESFTVTLSNPTGDSGLGAQTVATINILNDDNPPPGTNPIDDAATFVCQNYHDFLNRQGDAAGQAFWLSQITACGGNATCIEQARISVSASFFLSIEFQETGFFVLKAQRAAFGKRSANAALRYAYLPFEKDTQQVANGVIIGQPGADALLAANKQAYATQIVTSAAFITAYPLAQTATQYVDALFASAGVVPTTAERNAAIAAFGGGGTAGRVAAFRSVVDTNSLRDAEFNPAFVLMEYYGYLRRNPTDPPDGNDLGYQFWLTKLNSFGGNFINAEMVKAFLSSTEYRQRFGNP